MAKTRSPNFPLIDLGKAVGLSKKLYDKAQRHPMPVGAVKTDVWDMTATSSYADQALGAVRAFGLIDVTGKGNTRMVRVSDMAAKIAEEHPDRAGLLKVAALTPRINRTIWDRYAKDGGLPPDATIQTYLLFEHDPRFNRDRIPAFIKQLRASLSFAKVTAGDTIQSGDDGEDDDHTDKISVGEFVQWTSQGVEQFQVPRRVTSVSDDGYALVDGSPTGVPVAELSVANPPSPFDASPPPPFTPRRLPGMNQEIFALDSGNVTLQWPAKMTSAEYEDFKAWLEIIKRKAERATKEPAPTLKADPEPQ